MRVCLDLDGVVCELKRQGESYAELLPMDGAREAIRAFRAAGHTVILYTARHMKTCRGNVGEVVARVGKTTLDWLEQYGIEYDEIYFGKPQADVYIDDHAFRFSSWEVLRAEGGDMGVSIPGGGRTV